MRIDRLLCHLRFARTRSVAQRLVDSGHLRLNGARVIRPSQEVRPGDVLTLPLGERVRLIEVTGIPRRRGPAPEAQAHYRELDPGGQTAIAAAKRTEFSGKPAQ